jgi:HK97 family phage major capsid protein
MAYNDLIDRTESGALALTDELIHSLMESITEASASLTYFPTVRMSTKLARIPVVDQLPEAYFVNGDTGLKQTTAMQWAKRTFTAEEIACIVPVPDAVLDDLDYDLWSQIQPKVAEAIGRTLDAAVYFGTNAPASWTDANIVAKAVAAGNVYARGTSTQAEGGIGEDINQLLALVEDDGFDPNALYTKRGFKRYLRGARDTTGQSLFDVSSGSVAGLPCWYGMPGLWPTGLSAAELVAGDYSQGIVAVRQDITLKVLDQAVITDDTGAIIFNLPQQDMVALRCVARYGFVVANPVTHEQSTEADRYPFAVLESPAS